MSPSSSAHQVWANRDWRPSSLVARKVSRRSGGRCLSYGEGITYWPLREAVEQAPDSEERAAVLAALDAEMPLPAGEIGLLFRRLCETLARKGTLVLVFDDLHWAEPTFLEVIEGIADRGDGPILVVGVAREELLEDRPGFLADRKNAEQLVARLLVGGGDRDAARRSWRRGPRVRPAHPDRRAAEGNPFFLEQLLALALEGGLVERAVPETVQALLAARLDRLGPGERAVLERGAIIGKEFRLDDVAALLEPEAVPTVGLHMQALAARGFVRPAGEDEFRFRHVLVQDAVYRAAPKRLRAELHERFIDRFEKRGRAPVTSTSSRATTSSRRIGCARSSASPIDAPSASPRTRESDLVKRVFALASAATCQPR